MMNLKRLCVTLILLSLTAPVKSALAQSSVSENEPVTIYVNGQSGSDSNPGSSSQPLKTIQAGVNKAKAQNALGAGVKVLIASGVYRETVTVGSSRTSAPITFQAASAGTVFIDGADVLTKWYSGNPGVYKFPWTDTVSGCPLPAGWYTNMPPVVRSNEMVFVNGKPLTQVLSQSQLHVGTFYYNSSYKELQLYPDPSVDMNTAKVEVAARQTTLSVAGARNVVFRGLVFQHAASCINTSGAAVNASSNILFDSDQALWNNWSGLSIETSSNVTVQNTIANFNGGVGLSGFRDLWTLWQNNETDYNNWRGAMVGLYDFAQGGIKLMHIHGANVIGHRAYNNPSQGLWLDTDNLKVTVNNATLVGNIVANVQLEANQGPITLQNSSLCSGGMGIHLINTAGLTLTGNTFYNNGGNSFQNGQLFLAGNPGGRDVVNWETGDSSHIYTSNTNAHNNSFTGVGPQQYVFNTYLSGYDWSAYVDSLDSNNNQWFNSSNSTAFVIPAGKRETLGGWRDTSGQDQSSNWGQSAATSQGCWTPAPSYPDFQVLAHNAASYVSSYTMSRGNISIPLQIKSFNFGTVHLSASGLPSGVTASFGPSSLVSGASNFTLTASQSATNQTVPITVFATSGSRVHTITLMVAIRHP